MKAHTYFLNLSRKFLISEPKCGRWRLANCQEQGKNSVFRFRLQLFFTIFARMKIAFDAKRAFQNRTGLGNYSRYMLDILCRHFPQHEYVAYAPKQTAEAQMQRLMDTHSNLSAAFPEHGQWPALWRIRGISCDLVRDGVDVFHGLSGELPLTIAQSGVPAVVTIHDLIFLRFPQYYAPISRRIYEFKMRRACRAAHHIIAISECTKRDVVRFFGTDPAKISVVYQGCDPAFTTVRDVAKEADVRARYSLPERFVLSVGSIEERKNSALLVRALPSLPSDVSLVLVGKRTSYTARVEREAAAMGVSDRLCVLSSVPFADLPTLYRLASVFAYPSRYEGLGIPVLEAQRSGVPVLAATGSCLEEAGGDGALYVHPDDPRAAAEALNNLLENAELRADLLQKAAVHAACFDEATQAAQVMRILERVAGA